MGTKLNEKGVHLMAYTTAFGWVDTPVWIGVCPLDGRQPFVGAAGIW